MSRTLRRIVVFVAGLLLILLGLVLIVLPGPLTIPPILLGVWLWSREFEFARLTPGVYGLDSVYALIPAGHVNYFAPGIIVGPDRPTFEVRAGEAIYLGIWQMSLNETTAVTQLWRLDPRDGDAATRRANQTIGAVVLRETGSRAVQCSPHRLNTISQRQIC